MKDELFPFQKRAVAELRMKAADALGSYHRTKTPQVISLQAPTGAGKTIIMAAFVEEVYFGGGEFIDQPEAIFVWLSDSPSLNDQSKEKFQLRADRLKFDQCVTIKESSFDMEMLEDGKIYFLNTQKLSRTGNLSKHSDGRTYTIWETLENTAREKSDRLYFIIDEAHRGMQGKEAGKATSIMQRFLKGSKALKLSPMPVVIGVSATAARFNKLVGSTTSDLKHCVITANQVRSSGLLKDRIVITYPDDPEKNNDMAVLQAAVDEWKKKCAHWYQYSYEQHYAHVNPIFVIQVLAGRKGAHSDTNLDDVIAQIEERLGNRFQEYEVVHTFGSTAALEINGLPVHHVEPSDITSDKRIRVVLFKENLSTGWDCPRAETIDELQNAEGGDIPTVIDEESLEQPVYASWSVRPTRKKEDVPLPGQFEIGELNNPPMAESGGLSEAAPAIDAAVKQPKPQQEPTPLYPILPAAMQPYSSPREELGEQLTIPGAGEIDREKIIKFINEQGLLTYLVRSVKINSYLKSLLNLVSLLTQANIYAKAGEEVRTDVINMMRSYIDNLRQTGQYEELSAQVLSLKLSVRIFDIFGEALDGGNAYNLFTTSENDLDRQLRIADTKLGGYGFTNVYGREFCDPTDPTVYKIDCILFAADDDCMAKLHKYAEEKFHSLDDQYRKYVVNKSEQCKQQYFEIAADSDIVSKHNFSLPGTISVRIDEDGKEYYNHLFADDEGVAKIKLNNWEAGVLEEESKRPDFVCWLRNPSKAKWSLCIPYEIDNEIKPMYPDFLIVRRDDFLNYVIDILEPHGDSYKDNLGKAKGLAKYAMDEARIGRVQLIRESKAPSGKLRFKRLDFSKGAVRDKVLKAINNDELDHIFDTDGFFEQ